MEDKNKMKNLEIQDALEYTKAIINTVNVYRAKREINKVLSDFI